ncbi:outer membrane protein assembly factor BamB family protein [Haloarcula sp. CGMCC 1.2071]|uniref:outer membrane protein assembly factor BamB family protein n=1 Tax=Haloarcula sp. CGMCC 1.2071 TaxID=3111454 RepID=UPI00300E8469
MAQRRDFLKGFFAVASTAGCLRFTGEQQSTDTPGESVHSGQTTAQEASENSKSITLTISEDFNNIFNEPEFLRVNDGILYSVGNYIQAVDVESQDIIWQTKVNLDSEPNSVSITRSGIYVGGSTRVQALAPKSGEILWTFHTDKINKEHSGFDALSANNDRVFAGLCAAAGEDESVFFSLNATEGTKEFHTRIEDYVDSIVTHDGLAYLGIDTQSMGYNPEKKALFSTQIQFGIDVGGVMRIVGNLMLLRDRSVKVHDLAKKTNVFKKEVPGYSYIPPTLTNESIISAGETGIYSHDGSSGSEQWHIRTTSTIRSSIVPYESFVLSADTSGNLYCIDVSSGELILDQNMTGGNRIETLGVVDDTLFLTDSSGQVKGYTIMSG